jgi:hypothetical protein
MLCNPGEPDRKQNVRHANDSKDGAEALRAVEEATLAIFAYRDGKGRASAWPITPYRRGDRVVVTSTLAFVRKALHVRRDPRVSLLVSGVHLRGRAEVRADPSGREFARSLLAQEIAKYPPTAEMARIPLHRVLFSWYFGRVLIEVAPDTVRTSPGDDFATLVSLDEDGFPRIDPIAPPALDAGRFHLAPGADGVLLQTPDGPAQVLFHLEPTPLDLRQLRWRGEVRTGEFVVRTRDGSLDAAPALGLFGELRRHLEYHRRGRAARRLLRGWSS